ncbi:hypothetical protein Q3G72_018370 [Acer saccharum]|nr:hypothetical protein Q3G72_018370 [Acer saccharum]
MALMCLSVSSQNKILFGSAFFPSSPSWMLRSIDRDCQTSRKKPRNISFSVSCSAPKIAMINCMCVRLTPAAATLAKEEMNLKSAISITLANKLYKLDLMLLKNSPP